MFDLSNLNDVEFELLCRDIMQKKLNKELHTFPRGADGGIDICDSNLSPNVVIQVKHYCNSTFSQLLSSLKKEISKVSKLNPNHYYICTSLPLTKAKRDEIVNMFPNFMENIENVIDKTEISAFLEDEDNQDIVKKNYKLWLCASNVLALINNQDVFIDCDELISDIEKCISLFVETDAYIEAKKKLFKNNIIIITGAPGVGKSTISKMLLLFFANDGYTVRYVTNNNLANIKQVLSLDSTKKEIVLLDDFLGQHYLNIKDSQPNELKALISFIEKRPNKKLIMNSRITILNEAVRSFITFQEVMEQHDDDKYLIDLDKMTRLEKAKILYNHIYFNELPKEYFSNIKSNQNYLKIVGHKNYNPRIIEHVTKSNFYNSIKSSMFVDNIFKQLNNPKDVWRDEFNHRLCDTDRMLANTLYSLTDNFIDCRKLKSAFNKRIIKSRIDTSNNPFENSLIRLTDSILKRFIDYKKNVNISVLNPSINDYILSEIKANPSEQVSIICSAQYVEQMEKMNKSPEAKNAIIDRMHSDFFEMSTLENSVFYYFLKFLVDWEIYDSELNSSVANSLEKININFKVWSKDDEYARIIFSLMEIDYYNFYSLDKVFLSTTKLQPIIRPLNLYEFEIFFYKYIDLISSWKYKLDSNQIAGFKEILVDKISKFVQEEVRTDLSDIGFQIIQENADLIQEYECNRIQDVQLWDELERLIWNDLQNVIIFELENKINYWNCLFSLELKDFSIHDMKDIFDISGYLYIALKARNEKDYDKIDDDGRYDRNISEQEQIREMFER